MNMNQIFVYIDRNFSNWLKDLQKLIQQPSVSAKNEGIEKCSRLVCKTLKDAGINSQILKIKNNAAPLVYGEVKSKSNPAKTILFYNHYDVQPPEPLELWNYSPFSGKIIGNKIYGRGASDDKGELITRIKAVESYLQTYGDVPCNIKFVIEGEEEIGSPNIEKYLTKYKKKFSCDGVIWEFGYIDSKGRPIVGLGMKGLLYVELTKIEAKRDAHSSLAVLIKNPAWRLVEALNTLRNSHGKILIKDWYKEVRPVTKRDLALLKKEPFDAQSFKKEFGITEFLGKKNAQQAKISLATEPTCNIAGFISGYVDEGAKTVLPHKATAKIDFRLVPDMDPQKQVFRLKRHLRSKGFTDLKIKIYHGEAAARTNPSEKLVKDTICSVQKIYGSHIVNISNAGTGPMHSFQKILKAPCVSVGSTYIFSRIHSPNEFARLDLLKKTTKSICLIMKNFAN